MPEVMASKRRWNTSSSPTAFLSTMLIEDPLLACRWETLCQKRLRAKGGSAKDALPSRVNQGAPNVMFCEGGLRGESYRVVAAVGERAVEHGGGVEGLQRLEQGLVEEVNRLHHHLSGETKRYGHTALAHPETAPTSFRSPTHARTKSTAPEASFT